MQEPKKESMILTATKEELAAIEKEKKAATRKDNRLMLNAVKDSLAELHKYDCGKSKDSLQKDYKLPDFPEENEAQSGKDYGATDEGKEYSRIDEQYMDAHCDHQFCIGYDISEAIFNLIDNQECEKCGEHHAEPTNWARDRVLMSLLEGAAARLIKSDEYGYAGKADALERVIVMATDAYISHEGNTEVVNDAAFTNIINSVALALPNHRRQVFDNPGHVSHGTVSLWPTNLGGSA